jgi:hypothetical protein
MLTGGTPAITDVVTASVIDSASNTYTASITVHGDNTTLPVPAGTPLPGNISGFTVGPGVHSNPAAVGSTAGTVFIIDGEDNPDAVFIFQVGGALTLGANFHIELIKGAQATNVFWQVNGAGGIGADSTFVGTMLANGAITSGANSVINGRLLTKTGAITMDASDLDSGGLTASIDGGTAAQRWLRAR